MAVSFAKKMKARYTKITNDAAKVNLYIHETCLMIFDHAFETGDCREIINLYNAMPASYRREKMLDWFRAYTPCRVNTSTGKAGLLKESDKNFTPWDREEAEANPWNALADRDPEVKVYDFKKLVEMVKRISKQIESKVEKGEVPEDDIPSAHAIAAQLEALKFTYVKPPVADNDKEASTEAAPETQAT